MANRNPTPRKRYLKVTHFQYPIVNTVPLIRPKRLKEVPFFKTVLSRRSSSSFGRISGSKLSQLLYYTTKNIEIGFLESGNLWAKRPSPSAGGIHPIDIIIYDPSQGPRLYYYDPVEHSMSELRLEAKETSRFIKHVRSIKTDSGNAIILWMVAHKYRTNAKYKNSESLIWRDAGCLLYCINLVSAALEIPCCPLGSLGEPFISGLFRKHGEVEGVGGCLVG
jgi:SagB-type dehydrogenase family enzyme